MDFRSKMILDSYDEGRLTWIFAVVFGSRKDFTVLHNILNPGPALIMNMRYSVY